MISNVFVGCLLPLLFSVFKVNAQYGIISTNQEGDVDFYCARYVVPGRPLATNWNDAPNIPLVYMSNESMCQPSDVTRSLSGAIVVVDRFNCSVFTKTLIAQNNGAAGIIVVSPILETKLPTVWQLQMYNITIPFAVISEETINEVKNRQKDVEIMVKPFIPEDKYYFDYSYLFMAFIAMSTVTLGAFWTEASRKKVATWRCESIGEQQETEMFRLQSNDESGEVELFSNTAALRSDDVTRRKNSSNFESVSTINHGEIQSPVKLASVDTSTESIGPVAPGYGNGMVESGNDDNEYSNQFTSGSNSTMSSDMAKFVMRFSPYFIFLILLTAQVLLMYYFFDYMVYYAIFWFCLASALGLCWCLIPFIDLISFGCFNIQLCCKYNIIHVVYLTFCLVVPAIWCVCRHENFAWILQDILGVASCAAFIGWKRIPTLKFATVILIFFFFYDVFLVFITPLFTSDGKSVMEKMIIGGSDVKYSLPKEEAPSVFKLPFISENPMIYCASRGYLLLGFGDIIVPGLLFGCCHDFAAKIRARHIYMPAVCLGYGCGLVLTGVVLHLSAKPQPALFYLVPCCLISVIIAGAARKELKYFWTGNVKERNYWLNDATVVPSEVLPVWIMTEKLKRPCFKNLNQDDLNVRYENVLDDTSQNENDHHS